MNWISDGFDREAELILEECKKAQNGSIIPKPKDLRWQALENAPKTGEQILMWDGEDVEIYSWNKISETFDSWSSHWTIYLDDTVARWMPLPAPPEEKEYEPF